MGGEDEAPDVESAFLGLDFHLLLTKLCDLPSDIKFQFSHRKWKSRIK